MSLLYFAAGSSGYLLIPFQIRLVELIQLWIEMTTISLSTNSLISNIRIWHLLFLLLNLPRIVIQLNRSNLGVLFQLASASLGVILVWLMSVHVHMVCTLHFTSLTHKGIGYHPCVLVFIHSEFGWTIQHDQEISWPQSTTAFTIQTSDWIYVTHVSCNTNGTNSSSNWNIKYILIFMLLLSY